MVLNLLLFPFQLLWSFVGFAFGVLGFLLSLIIGGVTLVIGLLLTATFFGALLGIPLIFLGIMLVVKAILK